MVIFYTDDFLKSLIEIRNFIAKDSKLRADDFTELLRQEIEKIPYMPYKHRQNLDAENENVRDLIFKGYVIVFHISQRYNTITILQIYKRNQPKINFKNLA